MSAMRRKPVLRWVRNSSVIAGLMLMIGCMRLTPLPPIKPAVDMFSTYDGQPSTAAEREQALNDCYSYNRSLGLPGPTVQANQICMLQLGFRAPKGELPGLASSDIQGSLQGCVGDAGDPVCWAAKYGWPQTPPPRWAKPGADPDNLGNVWYDCFARYRGVYPYAAFAAKVDRCMVQRYGYAVAHPNSPAVPWLPHQYWPNCKKPEAEMNWLEKKWCPGQRPLSPPPETTQR